MNKKNIFIGACLFLFTTLLINATDDSCQPSKELIEEIKVYFQETDHGARYIWYRNSPLYAALVATKKGWTAFERIYPGRVQGREEHVQWSEELESGNFVVCDHSLVNTFNIKGPIFPRFCDHGIYANEWLWTIPSDENMRFYPMKYIIVGTKDCTACDRLRQYVDSNMQKERAFFLLKDISKDVWG